MYDEVSIRVRHSYVMSIHVDTPIFEAGENIYTFRIR